MRVINIEQPPPGADRPHHDRTGVYVCVSVCMCVSVCIVVCMGVCVCVCVCALVWECVLRQSVWFCLCTFMVRIYT